jgi:hypothetical protein
VLTTPSAETHQRYLNRPLRDSQQTKIDSKTATAVFEHCATPTEFGDCLELGSGVAGCDPPSLQQHLPKFRDIAETLSPLIITDTICELVRLCVKDEHGASFVISQREFARVDGIRKLLREGYWFDKEDRSGFGPDPWNCGMLNYLSWWIHWKLSEEGVVVLKDVRSEPEALAKWQRTVCATRMHDTDALRDAGLDGRH